MYFLITSCTKKIQLLIHISKCNRHLPNVKSKAPVSDGHGNVFQGIVSENKTKRMKMKWRNKQKNYCIFVTFVPEVNTTVMQFKEMESSICF